MLKQKMKKTYFMSGAAFTVGLMTASGSAHAAPSFNSMAEGIATSTEQIPGLISAIAYLLGTLLGVLGIMKIKDHVENPSQTPLKDGAIRLVVGGALFALPAILAAMAGSLGGADATGPVNAKLNKSSFSVN